MKSNNRGQKPNIDFINANFIKKGKEKGVVSSVKIDFVSILKRFEREEVKPHHSKYLVV